MINLIGCVLLIMCGISMINMMISDYKINKEVMKYYKAKELEKGDSNE